MEIFGILNVTPDSFSDGGQGDYINRAQQMIADGASVIDIGAESTRPGAQTVTVEEELKRLIPVLNHLSSSGYDPRIQSRAHHASQTLDPRVRSEDNSYVVSIDTRNYETAKQVIKFPNVKYLNDVSGFADARMLELAAEYNLNIIAMHSLSVPADKNITLKTPPVETISKWIENKLAELAKYISKDKIIFDPGLGFGKTAEQSKELIERSGEIADLCHNLGTKILYGHSRKSFLDTGTIHQRDLETAKISNYLQNQGVDYIRVHNVALNRAALIP